MRDRRNRLRDMLLPRMTGSDRTNPDRRPREDFEMTTSYGPDYIQPPLTEERRKQIDRCSPLFAEAFEKISDLDMAFTVDTIFVYPTNEYTVGMTVDWDFLERSGTYSEHAKRMLDVVREYLAEHPE